MRSIYDMDPVRLDLGTTELPSIHVHQGRYVTLWIQDGTGAPPFQVEIHVTHTGEARMCCNDFGRLRQLSFAEVYPSPTEAPK